MSNPTRFCNSCRYSSFFNQFCNRPNRPLNPVTGNPKIMFCDIEREYELSGQDGHCNKIGQFHSDVYPPKGEKPNE